MTEQSERYPYPFLGLYALIYMASSIFIPFMPVYLSQIGYNRSMIGALLAIGPLLSVLSQPVWGLLGDRSRSKNRILMVMLAGTAVTILLFLLSNTLAWLILTMGLFFFFQASIFPLSDAITLEYLQTRSWRFGPIRMAGTIGFACTALAAGYLADWNIRAIFPLYAGMAVLAFVSVSRLPVIRGHQRSGQRLLPWVLFRNKPVMLMIAFNFIVQVTLGYYYSFFPIHLRQLGADSTLLGLAMLVAAGSEIPFLLNADKIIGRFGIALTLIVSTVIMAARWLLTASVTSVAAVIAVNVLHGFSFIVFNYCLAVYINEHVPDELKASGQTLNALICIGLGRLSGSVLGGLLSDRIGLADTFLVNGLLGFGTAAIFGLIFWLRRERQPARPAS